MVVVTKILSNTTDTRGLPWLIELGVLIGNYGHAYHWLDPAITKYISLFTYNPVTIATVGMVFDFRLKKIMLDL